MILAQVLREENKNAVRMPCTEIARRYQHYWYYRQKGIIQNKDQFVHNIYIYIYIYIWYPPKTYADFNFTGIYSEFYLFLAPILFR